MFPLVCRIFGIYGVLKEKKIKWMDIGAKAWEFYVNGEMD